MTTEREKGIIVGIREKVANGLFEFSKHATDQIVIRDITVREVRDAIASCELVEDYPDDKYGPSVLVLGFAASNRNRPLHIHCSYPSRTVIKVVTLYEPDPVRWIDFRTRR